MDQPLLTQELKNFLDADGRLTRYPSKHKKKMLSLLYLASKMDPGARYTEQELNQILRKWHTFEDWALLRRDLYDRRLIDREPSGAHYWLEAEPPALADLI